MASSAMLFALLVGVHAIRAADAKRPSLLQYTSNVDMLATTNVIVSNQAVSSEHMRIRQKELVGTKEELTCDASNKCDGICTADVKDKNVPSFKMRVVASDMYISRTALCERTTWEFDLVQKAFEKLGASNGGLLDIGANLGSWTLPFAASGRPVVAVEVSPGLQDTLKDSLKLNSMNGVSVHNVAVVSQKESGKKICMGATDEEILSSANSGGNQVNLGSRDFCKQEVSSTTLDELFETDQSMNNIVMVKLDCEGCEAQALMGAKKFLSEAAPCMIAMEVTEGYLCQAGTSVSELRTLLESVHYDTSSITTKTDGTCEDYTASVHKGTIEPFEQSFVYIEHHNFDECINKRRH